MLWESDIVFSAAPVRVHACVHAKKTEKNYWLAIDVTFTEP